MEVLERVIVKVRRGKWAELKELHKKLQVIASRCGFPPARYYHALSGLDDWDTLIIEREWESLAAWEAACQEREAGPEIQPPHAEGHAIEEGVRFEAYTVLKAWSEADPS